MFIHKPSLFAPRGGTETPASVALHRRGFLRKAGWAALGAGAAGLGAYAAWKWYQGQDAEVLVAGKPELPSDGAFSRQFPASRDQRFEYGRPETPRIAAARYTNFYEFSRFKSTWRYVEKFRSYPWRLTIAGLCRAPLSLDLDELARMFARSICERQYRHRCVERWAMAIPWTGIPLRELILAADPLPQATHVRLVSFQRPDQAPGMANDDFPWPYTEGLTLPEAMHELVLLATGMYGQPLLKQHGAPLRLVVPWKYGYKSIKSLERIELVDRRPTPFWTEIAPRAYPFDSNVNPGDTYPWPQAREYMLGSGDEYATRLFNGYEKYVAHLYPRAAPNLG